MYLLFSLTIGTPNDGVAPTAWIETEKDQDLLCAVDIDGRFTHTAHVPVGGDNTCKEVIGFCQFEMNGRARRRAVNNGFQCWFALIVSVVDNFSRDRSYL
jgi:hypothetical protein